MSVNLAASRRRSRGPNRATIAVSVVLTLTAGLVPALLVTTSTAWTAGAQDKPTAIISLGDSFISGEAGRWAGNGNAWADGDVYGTDRAVVECTSPDKCTHDVTQVYGDTAYDVGNGCDRSDVAEIKGADIDGVPKERRFNIACSGAITDNVTKTEFKTEKPQVEQLRDKADEYKITTIVLSISGNDLEFTPIIKDCVKAFLAPVHFPLIPVARPCNETHKKPFHEALPIVKEEVIATVNAIQSTMREAGYGKDGYRLILQSYPAPIPRSGKYRYEEHYDRYSQGGCPFLDVDTDWANDDLIPSISSMLSEVALTTEVSFLDLTNAFAGHELCANDAEQATKDNNKDNRLPAERAEWVRWIPYLVNTNYPWEGQGNKQEGIHPNAFGQEALSTCLTKMVAASPSGGDVFRCTGAAKRGPGEVTVSKNPMRVMALGSSTTFGEGSSNGSGYRSAADLGFHGFSDSVDWAGSIRMNDRDIEGWRSHQINEIADKATCAVRTYQPNVITLLAGESDVIEDFEMGDAIGRLEALIHQVRADAPGAVVLVSGMPRFADPDTNQRGLEFSAQIRDMTNRFWLEGLHVLYADTGGLDLSDIGPDGIHPNDQGYDKIGKAFADAARVARDMGWIQKLNEQPADVDWYPCGFENHSDVRDGEVGQTNPGEEGPR